MRTPVSSLAVLIASLGLLPSAPRCAAASASPASAPELIAAVAAQIGGELGVAVLDLKSGRRIEFHPGARVAMCSTFKFLLAAAILRQTEEHRLRLDQFIAYGPGDLLGYSPITGHHLARGGLTAAELCAAAVEYSDNTAANILLRQLGGPSALTRFARSIGDPVTRLDRNEPDLNAAELGDVRDTTTPRAMLDDLQALLLGHALSRDSQGHLEAWLSANTTGAHRLRAGLPAEWKVGDKTGTGDHGAMGDIAIVRPPLGGPILITVYEEGSTASVNAREAAIATVARLVAASFGA